MERVFDKRSFDLNAELVPFVEQHWADLGAQRDRSSKWATALTNNLKAHAELFVPSDDGAAWSLKLGIFPSEDEPLTLGSEEVGALSLRAAPTTSSPPASATTSASASASASATFSSAPSPLSLPLPSLPSPSSSQSLSSPLSSPRSPRARRVGGVKSVRASGEWCHQCKQKHQQVLPCTAACPKKYCFRCLTRHYDQDATQLDATTWLCPHCRHECTCAACQGKAEELKDAQHELQEEEHRSERPRRNNRRSSSDRAASKADPEDEFVPTRGNAQRRSVRSDNATRKLPVKEDKKDNGDEGRGRVRPKGRAQVHKDEKEVQAEELQEDEEEEEMEEEKEEEEENRPRRTRRNARPRSRTRARTRTRTPASSRKRTRPKDEEVHVPPKRARKAPLPATAVFDGSAKAEAEAEVDSMIIDEELSGEVELRNKEESNEEEEDISSFWAGRVVVARAGSRVLVAKAEELPRYPSRSDAQWRPLNAIPNEEFRRDFARTLTLRVPRALASRTLGLSEEDEEAEEAEEESEPRIKRGRGRPRARAHTPLQGGLAGRRNSLEALTMSQLSPIKEHSSKLGLHLNLNLSSSSLTLGTGSPLKAKRDLRSRVTVADLLREGVLRVGDAITYKSASHLAATLRSDGQLQLGATVFNTLSQFAKWVATRTEQARASELINGWATLRCRGHSLDELRTLLADKLSGHGLGNTALPSSLLTGESLSLEARDEELGVDATHSPHSHSHSHGANGDLGAGLFGMGELGHALESGEAHEGDPASLFLSIDPWHSPRSSERDAPLVPSPRSGDLPDPWDAQTHSASWLL